MQQKIKVHLRENSLLAKIAAALLKFPRVAVVFGTTIHLFHVSEADFLKSKTWVLHELKHVDQYRKMGPLLFLLRYFAGYLSKGYYKNKLEQEARAAETDTTLLLRYEIIRASA